MSSIFSDRNKEGSKARLDEVAKACSAPDVASAAYSLLFPQTGRVLHNSVVGRFAERDAQRWRRVADPGAFWTYVTAALPKAGISVAEIRATLDAMKNPDALTVVLESNDIDHLGRLFERLRAHINEVDIGDIPRIARAIATHVRSRTGSVRERFDDPVTRITWFVVDLISQLPDADRHEFLIGWAAAERDVAAKLAVYEISHYETDRGNPIIGKENLTQLQAEIAQLVCATAPDELLAQTALGRLLWLSTEPLERNQPALHLLLDDDRIFVRYLSVFTEPSFGDGPRPLAWPSLKESLGADWLSDRVNLVDAALVLTDELAEVLATARGFVAAEEVAEG